MFNRQRFVPSGLVGESSCAVKAANQINGIHREHAAFRNTVAFAKYSCLAKVFGKVSYETLLEKCRKYKFIK